MLQSVRVRNFALIEELDVTFERGLNILTGETGAGKSILLGSIQTALGAKASKELIRNGAESAYVEIVFEDCGEGALEELQKQELSDADRSITISRRITSAGKSVSRINGEIVNAATVKAVAAHLLEIHGQQEHHSLLNREKHLELLDRYAGEEIAAKKETVAACWKEYQKLKTELWQAREEAANKNRDCSYLEFASGEIRAAAYRQGEFEQLEREFERLSHAKALAEGVAGALAVTADGAGETVDGLLNGVVKILSKVSMYDAEAETLLGRAEELTALLSDFNREAERYLESLADGEEEYCRVAERLDLLNHLKAKYGKTMEEVLAYGEECEEKLERYRDFDAYLERTERQYQEAEQNLRTAADTLSRQRQETAQKLSECIRVSLSELNFLEVRFELRLERTDYSANGIDAAEFYIATNPGEEMKPLVKVASGGELSRIMLAIKAVFADRDEIPTLIFDEIDTGISGRTAQMVSEKMAVISAKHQLLCITHLPQIAAMADAHFFIEKSTDGKKTVTRIERLCEERSVEELARMLGGVNITETVKENAREMKALAVSKKNDRKSS